MLLFLILIGFVLLILLSKKNASMFAGAYVLIWWLLSSELLFNSLFVPSIHPPERGRCSIIFHPYGDLERLLPSVVASFYRDDAIAAYFNGLFGANGKVKVISFDDIGDEQYMSCIVFYAPADYCLARRFSETLISHKREFGIKSFIPQSRQLMLNIDALENCISSALK
jgi:hypothetical protein